LKGRIDNRGTDEGKEPEGVGWHLRGCQGVLVGVL
jgi:hypothetical protein